MDDRCHFGHVVIFYREQIREWAKCTLYSLPLPSAMPVPDDGTRRNVEPKRRTKAPKMPQEAPIPPNPSAEPKSRKAKKRKGKEVEEPGDQEELFQVAEDSPWTWRSLTDSSASKVPPVLTKDGRYAAAMPQQTLSHA